MVEFFVRKHMAVFSFAVLVLIIGVMSYIGLPRESMPEVKQPLIFITTTYPGISAKDIESLVTRPIEEEIDGVEGLSEISSSSQQSLSFIAVEFTSDVSVENALVKVRERVDLAKAFLPDDADEPIIQELNFSNYPVFIATLSNPEYPGDESLKILHQSAELLRDELERIPGILEVDISGNLSREIAIDIDPVRLEHYGLSMDDVVMAVQSENISIPGGMLESSTKNYSLSVTGEIENPDEFKDIIIRSDGKQVKLEDLTTNAEYFIWSEQKTYSRLNGNPCISISVKKRTGENLIYVVDEAKKVIDKMKESFPAGTIVTHSYDESDDIKNMVADLENNMFTGFVLVLLVTIFFLGKINSLFVSMAIPFSMMMSFFALQLLEVSLNMVVLFSLILALGMLVDNGIVIVENIFRHATMKKSRIQAAIDGSQEVAGPIIASTVTTCLAFSPIIFMPGIMGDFLSFLPITVIVVLSSSLLVALTINPVFCSSFLKISEENRKKIIEGSGKFAKIQNRYEKIIKHTIKHPVITVGGTFIVVIIGIIMYGIFGKDPIFFPEFDPPAAIISIETPQGTPLNVTDTIVKRIEQYVETVPSSRENFQSTTGRGSGDDLFGGGGNEQNKASIRISFKPYAEREIKSDDTINEYAEGLRDFTGGEIKVEPLGMGIPSGNDFSYQITGLDYSVMGEISEKIMDVFREYNELDTIDSDFVSAKPEFQIQIDRQKASFYGLSTREIAGTIRNAINGSIIGKFRQDENEYDIIIRYDEDFRNSLYALESLQVINHDGERIPVSSLVVNNIDEDSSIGVIRRRNLTRAVNVWADFKEEIQGRQTIIQEIEKKISELTIPIGYYISSGEGLQIREESTDFLIQSFIIAIFLIMIVLIAQFNSVLEPFIIIFSVFLSLGGVFWGYFVSGQVFVIIMSGVGCIALAGVAVNNCIVLVDYTNILIKQHKKHFMHAIIEAGRTRLRPVLLTAITTVLGLIPMAAGVSFDVHKFIIQTASESGEFWKAFAWAMIYGLTFATITTLIIVPTLLSIKFKFFPPKNNSERH